MKWDLGGKYLVCFAKVRSTIGTWDLVVGIIELELVFFCARLWDNKGKTSIRGFLHGATLTVSYMPLAIRYGDYPAIKYGEI